MQITTAGDAYPGLGGYYQQTSSRANAVFYHVIVAKIPVGYAIQHAQNATGDGRVIEWLTPQLGTGTYQTYIYRHTCGSSGTFSTFGHVYISGTAATSSNPVTWYVAYSNMFDYTQSPNANDGQVFTYGAGNMTLTANWTPKSYTVTYDYNLFTASTHTDTNSNNLTITYDENNNYITLNGTAQYSFDFGKLMNPTISVGEQYRMTVEYISGTYTSSGPTIAVFDILKDSNFYTGRTPGTHYVDVGQLPLSGSISNTITITSAVMDCNAFYYRVWQDGNHNETFSNYKIRISATKVDSKNVNYGSTYGTLPTPVKNGYSFTGWYTALNGGTNITSSSTYTTVGNQTLYAHWTPNILTVILHANGATKNISGETISDNMETSNLPYNGSESYVWYNWPSDYANPWGYKLVRDGYNSSGVYHVGSSTSSTTIGQDYIKDSNGVTVITLAERLGILSNLQSGDYTLNLYAGWTICAAGTACLNGTQTTCAQSTSSVAGTYSSSAGSTTCTTASNGYYTTVAGATGQTICPKGYWCSGGKITQCPTGQTTSGTGSTSSSACYTPSTFAFSYSGKFRVNSESTVRTNTSYTFTSTPWKVYLLSSGTLTINTAASADIYVVGGGGGGGASGLRKDGGRLGSYAGAGGGGGGAARSATTTLSGSYSVTIGSGGAGAATPAWGTGDNGGTTSFGSVASAGGGSGGGCGYETTEFMPGSGGSGGTSGSVAGASGGRGGTESSYKGGNGGNGSYAFGNSSFDGVRYGAGGGGGAFSWANGSTAYQSSGGLDGGGIGPTSNGSGGYAVSGGNATANTGSGGGGGAGGGVPNGWGSGGAGGSGIAIIKSR